MRDDSQSKNTHLKQTESSEEFTTLGIQIFESNVTAVVLLVSDIHSSKVFFHKKKWRIESPRV